MPRSTFVPRECEVRFTFRFRFCARSSPWCLPTIQVEQMCVCVPRRAITPEKATFLLQCGFDQGHFGLRGFLPGYRLIMHGIPQRSITPHSASVAIYIVEMDVAQAAGFSKQISAMYYLRSQPVSITDRDSDHGKITSHPTPASNCVITPPQAAPRECLVHANA